MNNWNVLKIMGWAFTVAAFFTTQFISYPMVSGVISARNWEQVPCLVTDAWVGEHYDESTTYSVEVRYGYVYNGEKYVNDQYSFDMGSSSGWKSKGNAVEQMKQVPEQTCFVDPDDPEMAVINREAGWYLLWALFPLPFWLVGLGFLFLSRKVDF